MRLILPFVLSFVIAQPCCWAWSEGGHHLIAVLAFDELTPELQSTALEFLKSHPRFTEDFAVPEKVGDPEHWLIGRAGYWPDVARSQPKYNRPKWHYYVGASLKIGDPVNIPEEQLSLPEDATLETRELHLAQAVKLCRKVLKDKSKPPGDRAIALCWILHLVADAHQPCHVGSLYSQKCFPNGDRGGNEIPTKQSQNLHALWDGLLGPKFDEGDVRRRAMIVRDKASWKISKIGAELDGAKEPESWLNSGRTFAEIFVYAPEILENIKSVEDGTSQKLEQIDLPEEYLEIAGNAALGFAANAAPRLAAILAEDLAMDGK